MMIKNKIQIKHLLIVLVVLIISLVILPITVSKYETDTTSNVNTPVAYYVLDAGYQYLNVEIPNLKPQIEPFVYNFTISNNKDNKRAEVSLEYDLVIQTTTNLDLDYKLYLNEDYTLATSQNVIVEDTIIQDEYETYFRNMTTPTQYFDYRYNETNAYTLLIYFDPVYANPKYQDVFESIFITIDSKQTIN